MHNLADDHRFAEVKKTLQQALADYMRGTDDPRVASRGEAFARYPFGRAVRKAKWVVTTALGSWNCFITLDTPSG